MKEAQKIEIMILRSATGSHHVDITVDGEQIKNDRTARPYDSPGDAITSARHAVNGFLKGERS